MKIDGGLMGDLSEAGRQGARLEALGYNGAVTRDVPRPVFPTFAGGSRNSKH